MIDPLAASSLPRQRLSMQALVTVGVLHGVVLWLMLQSGAAVQATRQVVMQYFSPITQLPKQPTAAPVHAAPPVPKRVVVVPSPLVRVGTPVPLVEQTPAPVYRMMEAQTLQRTTVKIQDIKPQTDVPPVAEVPTSRIEPMLAAVRVLPDPEPLSVPKLPPDPLPQSVAPPAQTPPAPDAVVRPAAAAAPPPAPDPTTTAPAVPIAAPSRAAAITPVESPGASAGATGTTGSAGAQATMPAAAVPPGGSGLNLNFNGRADGRGRQKTVAEMANEQLNGNGRRDKMAESVTAAEKPDCINSGQALGLLAPIAIAYNVAKDKCK